MIRLFDPSRSLIVGRGFRPAKGGTNQANLVLHYRANVPPQLLADEDIYNETKKSMALSRRFYNVCDAEYLTFLKTNPAKFAGVVAGRAYNLFW
jgi:hypothetical protein